MTWKYMKLNLSLYVLMHEELLLFVSPLEHFVQGIGESQLGATGLL
jgi:hypothetical protein